jgi:hypothetical protein
MSTEPRTNVVGVFSDPNAADAAVRSLREEGFADHRIGVMPQGERQVVTVEADGRHGEAASCLVDAGAAGTQNVAR